MINNSVADKKPRIFRVTATPKGLNQILTVQPDIIAQYFCAVINVSDSPCATFDYQKAGVPSFWFPINEIASWGHSPFFGALKVVEQYYNGEKPVLIHCHAGANRSPSVAYAILRAKGYTPEEAEETLEYDGLSQVFKGNVERKQIPKNAILFLKECLRDPSLSLRAALRQVDEEYNQWEQKQFKDQQNYSLQSDSEIGARLVYNKESRRFKLVKD